MAQHPIEIILLQQWASMMNVPIWITDSAGGLVYFNEPLENLIGLRFDDAGEMPPDEVADRFVMCDLDGSPIPDHERPLVIALDQQQPAQRYIQIRAEDGEWMVLADTAIPIIGAGDRHLGAMVLLWDADASHS